MRHLTKRVLVPVPFLFTAATGRVASNQQAVAHHLADPDAPAKELAAAALAWRTAPPTSREATAELLRHQIGPLYLHYIDDHIARLAALGQTELARAFERWRERLVR